ncbi:hypothetical protein KC19_VG035400 [Ceratodon purpureus]|uniref:Uncharacterized protein n=1 Tax=Ceratodon purpureus TaxID=3225 RepID=A0A8T0HLL8_CERPU|nr:hypothetical protein KC19_VG035400 [Ceratodon purpureus]
MGMEFLPEHPINHPSRHFHLWRMFPLIISIIISLAPLFQGQSLSRKQSNALVPFTSSFFFLDCVTSGYLTLIRSKLLYLDMLNVLAPLKRFLGIHSANLQHQKGYTENIFA